MIAADLVDQHFNGAPLVCEACGLIGDGRVQMDTMSCRWERVVCRCGQVLALVDGPDILVPFGSLAGELLDEIKVRDLQWIHDVAQHPWVLGPCCALLGCTRAGCIPTYAEYVAGIVPPERAQRKAAMDARRKAKASALRAEGARLLAQS